jgi:hypothetical protein
VRAERLFRAVGLVLTVAAVVDAAWKRQLHGEVGGVVPYDFRPPTAGRLRRRVWAPDDERIFTPTVFGTGWMVNVGRLARLLGLV